MEKRELAETMIETFRERLNSMANVNKGWNKKIVFHLDDIDVKYLLQFQEDGTVNLEKGTVESADASVRLTVDTLEGLLKKEINPVMAMTQGLIQIEGDMGVLTRLAPVLM